MNPRLIAIVLAALACCAAANPLRGALALRRPAPAAAAADSEARAPLAPAPAGG